MLKPPETQTFWEFFKEPFDDLILRILLFAAVLDLVVDMWENWKTGWVDGAAIFFTVFLVAIVTAVNNYDKQKKFLELYITSETTEIVVIRNSEPIKWPKNRGNLILTLFQSSSLFQTASLKRLFMMECACCETESHFHCFLFSKFGRLKLIWKKKPGQIKSQGKLTETLNPPLGESQNSNIGWPFTKNVLQKTIQRAFTQRDFQHDQSPFGRSQRNSSPWTSEELLRNPKTASQSQWRVWVKENRAQLRRQLWGDSKATNGNPANSWPKLQ